MQTRSQTAKASQPSQPPKQAAYNQSANPVEHNPLEQRTAQYQKTQRGNSSTTRTADSQPSNDEAPRRLNAEHEQKRRAMQSTPDVGTEYGVEQQPAEGDIAHAVEGKSAEARARVQAGGSAMGPGTLGYEKGQAADLDRKMKEHGQMLGQRVSQSPAGPEAQNELVRERKLKQESELDVQGAVNKGSGGAFVG
ncbi:hypothetical protein BO71DRAFT_399259 [Aspergillus ellipticus CBS 707.79]|uniref:Uncharacterized protein n=1 Tax=Aspergillus ellipticus CBS 707.79 TaxID=1448320 RepID=A0A319E0B6_9EURO|nr:hypothetical protein BO71DRAFT_399259 [Aspergillus ellipticus CBS 707.79]